MEFYGVMIDDFLLRMHKDFGVKARLERETPVVYHDERGRQTRSMIEQAPRAESRRFVLVFPELNREGRGKGSVVRSSYSDFLAGLPRVIQADNQGRLPRDHVLVSRDFQAQLKAKRVELYLPHPREEEDEKTYESSLMGKIRHATA